MIIGFCGPAGAGKSTVALLASAQTGLPILPFAGTLKRMLVAMGVPYANIHGTPAQKAAPLDILGDKSARYAMQTLGTEWGRNLIADDIWVRAWSARVPPAGCIVDDVRFPNEVAEIHRLGGIVLRVIRSRDEILIPPTHVSENFSALDYDFCIDNFGNEKDLSATIKQIISEMRSGQWRAA